MATPDLDDENPFAAPRSDLGFRPEGPGYEDAPEFKLFSPGQATWATFLGSPMAGSVVLAVNYARLGNRRAAWTAIIVGLVVTIIVLGTATVLPDSFPNSVLSGGYTLCLYMLAKSLQGNLVKRHLAIGGQQASSWVATGIGIACLVVIFVIVVGIVLVLPDTWVEDNLSEM